MSICWCVRLREVLATTLKGAAAARFTGLRPITLSNRRGCRGCPLQGQALQNCNDWQDFFLVISCSPRTVLPAHRLINRPKRSSCFGRFRLGAEPVHTAGEFGRSVSAAATRRTCRLSLSSNVVPGTLTSCSNHTGCPDSACAVRISQHLIVATGEAVLSDVV